MQQCFTLQHATKGYYIGNKTKTAATVLELLCKIYVHVQNYAFCGSVAANHAATFRTMNIY